MRAPVQPRGGHTALPNELLARALGELTAEQFRLLVGLFYEAEFKRDGGAVGPWRVGFGQVLVSYEGLSERYGLSVDAVRRALRRFGALGIASRRAEAATPAATGPATSPATPAATPPTIVDLGQWGAFLGPAREPATPPATSAATPIATPPAPIQHRNTGTPNTEKPSPTPAAPARSRPRRKDGAEPDSRHRPLQERLEAVFLEARGSAYGFRGGRDAKAIAELLRLSGGDVAEVEARWRRGLELGGRWPGCATFGQLSQRWNDLAVHVRRPARATAALRPSGSPELDRVLAAAGATDRWGAQTILDAIKSARFNGQVFTLEAAGELGAKVLETWREQFEGAARRELRNESIEVHVTVVHPGGAAVRCAGATA